MKLFSYIAKNSNELWTVQRRSFLLLYSNFKVVVLSIVLLATLSALVPFASTGGLAYLVQSIIASLGGDTSVSITLAVAFVIAASALPQIIGIFRNYADRSLWLRGGAFLNLLYTKRRIDIDIAHYEDPKLHDMLQKIEERNIWPMLNVFEYQTANLTNVVGVAVSSIVLLSVDWRFLLILIVGTLPSLFLNVVYGKDVWSIFDANSEERRRFGTLKRLTENLQALMEIRIHQIGGIIHSRITKLLNEFTSKQVAIEKKKLIWTILATVASLVAIALVFTLTIQSAFAGVISVGAILFVLTAVREFEGSLERFFSGLGRMYEWHLFTRELFRLFDLTPIMPVLSHPAVLSRGAIPEIRFENVSFRYPGTEVDVLRGVTFTIKEGSSCALVGVNGAGKSTLVKLLARFYDPSEGRILVNGIDLREIEIGSWYRLIGVLFQEYPVYRGVTVAASISLGGGDGGINSEHVQSAAEQAGANEFISEWPLGYDEIIGKEFTHGIDPSRGQMQRLALARIFYRSPKFIILDEPTATVDAEAEEHIFHEIGTAKKQTQLLISHRFSTVRNADAIIILDGGAISEMGTHDELMKHNKIYAKLFRLQAKGYLESPVKVKKPRSKKLPQHD